MNSYIIGDRDLSYDEDIIELTRKYKMFLMGDRRKFGNVWGEVKHAKFQDAKLVDKNGRRVYVCPLCFEEEHKRVNCSENDHPLLRFFKWSGVGHIKRDCPNGKLQGQVCT